MVPNWYVITGGPSSGKTTTINELSKLGFHTVPETAKKLSEFLFKAYADLGYEVIKIPAMSVEDRVKMILSYVENA